MDGEDAGFAAEITKLAVGITGEDFATVAAEELDGGGLGGVRRRSYHSGFGLVYKKSWEERLEEDVLETTSCVLKPMYGTLRPLFIEFLSSSRGRASVK